MVRSEWAVQAHDYSEFRNQALNGGAKVAHMITKIAPSFELPPERPSFIEEITIEEVKWHKLWKVNENPASKQDKRVLMGERFPIKLIKETAKSFDWGTSCMDGIPIRCVGLLSDEMLEALSDLFQMATMFAHYPEEMETMAVKLLGKKDGTFRPIILFRSLFRLHGRLLASRTRGWEKHNLADEPFGNNQGKEALDSVYRACIRQAIGLSGGVFNEAADVLIDLRKCFEHLSRELLWEACDRHGYPMHVARMSIASYGWPRFLLGRYDLCGKKVRALRGIAAGSPFATTELKVYLLTLAKAIKATHGPGLTLSIYVDDFSLAVRGKDTTEVCHTAVNAYRQTVQELGKLELDIAGDD